jgi:tetratricopeptide (TPR) repeat protein
MGYTTRSFMKPRVNARSSRLVAVVAFWALVGPALAEAERAPADGVALFRQARFDDAEAAFEAVLEATSATAGQVAAAHLYLAALALVANDEAAAAQHARAAVALDPAATAPEGSPLRLEALLRDAAAALPEGGLAVAIEAPSCPAAGAPVQVRASLTGAPPGLVSSLVLRCACGAAPAQEAEAAAATVVELAASTNGAGAGDSLECTADARSTGGATLRSRRLAITLCQPAVAEVEAGAGAGAASDDAERERRRRRIGLGVGLGVGGALVAAAAVVLGVLLGTGPDSAEIGEVGLDGP